MMPHYYAETSLDSLPDLNRFAGMVWGNHKTVLKQHVEGFEYIDLSDPGYLDAFRGISMGIVKDNKLLVRNEYQLAFQELQGDTYKGGAYVLGLPGIGESQITLSISLVSCSQGNQIS
jgi:hypothetical protein